MNLFSLKTRMPGGDIFERLKYLKNYAPADNKILQAYLEYLKYAYWHGGKNCTSNSYFSSDSKKVFFGDIIIPNLSGHAIGTFWDEFPDVLLPYLLKRDGNKYDFSEINKLMREGPYELDDDVSLNSGDIVIDCGANIGLFSAIASKRGAFVYAFEPDESVIDNYLSKTANYNGNIEICSYGLSDHTGVEHFASDSINIGAGRLIKDSGLGKEVRVTTLDTFVLEKNIDKIDFIKADIEGAEREMLRGATRILRDFAPKLSICTYHLPDDKEVLEKIVLDANPKYQIRHVYQKMYAYVK